MKTVRLTTAQAIVRFLTAQRTLIDGEERPLVAGVFAIFGHGNVTCLGEALHDARGVLPTYRGQNEQGMALAAIGFAKAMRRRQFMVATSSVGPGAMNMVTAAGGRARQPPAAAAALRRHVPARASPTRAAAGRALRPALGHGQRRLPAGHALLGPHHAPGAGRASRCRSRSPRCSTRPSAARPSSACRRTCRPRPTTIRCGCSSRVVHELRRLRPDHRELAAAAEALRGAQGAADRGRRRRALRAGRGAAARASPSTHGVPVVETMAGKSTLVADHPLYAGPIGVTGAPQANALAARGRRRAGRRHAPAGLHDRLVDGLRQRGPAHHRPQRGALRRRQAPQPAARRPTRSRVSRRSARRSAAGRAAGAWRSEARRQARLSRASCGGGRAAAGRERAVVRPGHRRRQREARDRTTTPSRRPAASPAS